MKLSPVQLIETDLVKVSVEYNVNSKNSKDGDDSDDADGEILLEHMTSIRRRKASLEEKDGTDKKSLSYFVVVGLRSGEKQSEDQPYTFEIVISGQIQVAVLDRPLDQVDDMAAKYGYTMLYSQIRETLLNITARMRRGEYMLPTMNFLDSKFPKEELV